MNKAKLKEQLVHMQEQLLSELSEKIEFTHSMLDLDEDDTLDPEDFSHQYESAEIEALFKLQLNRAKGKLAELNQLDFSPKSIVEPGAVIRTNQRNFILGFSSVPFEMDDEEYIGISRSAPIYACLQGKKAGQAFTFCGTNYQIISIH